ncbi:unnamed protein product, partial [Prorocentrum cordatum]
LEVLVGHMTVVALIRRELLSILHGTYRFVKKLYYESAPLWQCVKEEPKAFCGVYQTDAAPWAFGVAYSQWPVAAVADAGRVPERARFRLGAEAARSHAFAAAGLEGRDDGLLQARAGPAEDEALRWGRDRSFLGLPARLLHGSWWSTVMADKWRYEEGIIHLEARAVPKEIERLARSRRGHDARALFVGDNLGLTLALGRSVWSTTTDVLNTGIKMASHTIKSMSETECSGARSGDRGRWRRLERQARARSRSSRRARALTAARATSLQARLEAPALEPSGSLEAQARLAARVADAGSTVGDDESDPASEEAATEADRKEERLARQRARRRVARISEGKMTMLPGHSYLEAASVSEASRVRYRSCVQELLDLADRESMALCEDGEVGECLVAWMNSRYRLGDRAWRGEYMAAALMFAYPSFGRGCSRHVPRALQCLRGWRKLCPKFSRRPLPWVAWAAPALELLRSGRGRAGFGVLLMVSAYLMPSELLSLRRGSLAPPARGGLTDWRLRLFPQEKIERSKVGGADDAVVMNSERMRWADPVFAHLATGSSTEKLFPWDYHYQQFGEIGHLNQAWRRLGPDVQAFALVCEERLEDVFLRGAPVPVRPCPQAPEGICWTSTRQSAAWRARLDSGVSRRVSMTSAVVRQ